MPLALPLALGGAAAGAAALSPPGSPAGALGPLRADALAWFPCARLCVLALGLALVPLWVRVCVPASRLLGWPSPLLPPGPAPLLSSPPVLGGARGEQGSASWP